MFTTAAILSRHADEVTDIIIDAALTKESFEALTALIKDIDIASTNDSALTTIFDKLTEIIPVADAGAIMYGIIGYYYDYRIEVLNARYEQYGYSYMQRDLNALRHEKEVLLQDITKEDLASILRTLSLASRLRDQTNLSEQALAAVSDAEIVMLLQAQNCTEISISTEGWRILLNVFTSTLQNGYLKTIATKAASNGDLDSLAAIAGELMETARSIQMSVESTDVRAIRDGISPLGVLLSDITDEQWMRIDEIASAGWHSADYDRIATDQYGGAYIEYMNSRTIYTLSDVKAARGSADIDAIFIGYVSGICPAIAYEVLR